MHRLAIGFLLRLNQSIVQQTFASLKLCYDCVYVQLLLNFYQEVVHEVLPSAWPVIAKSISDHVDDVKAVAATSLLPITHLLPDLLPNEVCMKTRKLSSPIRCCIFMAIWLGQSW